ncbi:GntR family transcriptional regulator [Sneathiella sp.]|uniref:GntR family transcriptional regulator n=1 Tax=Sneathiella sp. TaxID=1964365 RepID=UPI00356B3D3C
MNKATKMTSRPSQARLSSPDQIVRNIIQGLYEGQFVAGQRLIEPDLMSRYAVSRGTVREAIKRLAAEGVATQTTYRGAHIRHLSRSEARDVLQLLEITIGLAARLAASNMDLLGAREQFTAAHKNLMTFVDSPDSFEFVRVRNQFYRAMTIAGGNRELERLMPGFQVHLIRTHLKQPQNERFADYRVMAEAILAGNKKTAEAAAQKHIRRVSEALNNIPDSTFAPDATNQQRQFEDEDLNHA